MGWNRQPVSFLVQWWISASRWPHQVNSHQKTHSRKATTVLALSPDLCCLDTLMKGYSATDADGADGGKICLNTAVLSKVLGCRSLPENPTMSDETPALLSGPSSPFQRIKEDWSQISMLAKWFSQMLGPASMWMQWFWAFQQHQVCQQSTDGDSGMDDFWMRKFFGSQILQVSRI